MKYDIVWCRFCGAVYAIEHRWFRQVCTGSFPDTLTHRLPLCCENINIHAGGLPYINDNKSSYVTIIEDLDPSHELPTDTKKDRIAIIDFLLTTSNA